MMEDVALDSCNSTSKMAMMFFHFSACVPNLLFESWTVSTPVQLFGAIVFSIVLAVLYEGLKSLREYLMCVGLQSSWNQAHKKCSQDGEEEDHKPLMINSSSSSGKHRKLKHYTLTWSMHSLQSGLHVLQVGLGYVLMLLAMTYNVWLFLAVAFGAGIGYFAFARVRHLSSPFREQQDHCS